MAMDYTFQFRDKIRVGVEGANSSQGRELINLLKDHLWFEVVEPHAGDFNIDAVGVPYLSYGLPNRSICVLPMLDAMQIDQVKKEGYRIHHPSSAASSLALVLHPIHQLFGIRRAHVVTALPIVSDDVPSLDVLDSVASVPSTFVDEVRSLLSINISAQAIQAPMALGLLHMVAVEFERRPNQDQIIHAWLDFQAPQAVQSLPSAPKSLLQYISDSTSLNTRRLCQRDRGRTVSIGALEPSSTWHYEFAIVSNPTICGPIGGAVLNAELLVRFGHVFW